MKRLAGPSKIRKMDQSLTKEEGKIGEELGGGEKGHRRSGGMVVIPPILSWFVKQTHANSDQINGATGVEKKTQESVSAGRTGSPWGLFIVPARRTRPLIERA